MVGAGSPGCQHLSVARVADALGVSWNTANDAVLAEGRRVLIDDPHRFDDVQVIGVDEHVWRHTRRGDKYVTVIIDLTPIRDGTGPARLLDMVAGRPKQAFKAWLAERDKSWRDNIEVVAMDGFTGFKTATTEELPEAVNEFSAAGFWIETAIEPQLSEEARGRYPHKQEWMNKYLGILIFKLRPRPGLQPRS